MTTTIYRVTTGTPFGTEVRDFDTAEAADAEVAAQRAGGRLMPRLTILTGPDEAGPTDEQYDRALVVATKAATEAEQAMVAAAASTAHDAEGAYIVARDRMHDARIVLAVVTAAHNERKN